jgi:shikimate kinase
MKIFLMGFMGSGKTHWGAQLSEKLHLPFYDLDEKISEKEDKSINDLFFEEGEEYFRLIEKDTLHLITESHSSFVMACGGGTPCFFNNIDYMKRQGVTVWMHCSIDCLFKRLEKEKEKRPLIAGLNDKGLRSFIIKKYADRKIYYEQASIIINEEEITLENLTEKIFHS